MVAVELICSAKTEPFKVIFDTIGCFFGVIRTNLPRLHRRLSCSGGPNLFVWVLVMFLNHFFQQERFKRFRSTKFWSKLTLKCYAYTLVKADEQIVREGLPTPVSYLKRHSHSNLNFKKLGNQKPAENTVSISRRTTLIMMNAG